MEGFMKTLQYIIYWVALVSFILLAIAYMNEDKQMIEFLFPVWFYSTVIAAIVLVFTTKTGRGGPDLP